MSINTALPIETDMLSDDGESDVSSISEISDLSDTSDNEELISQNANNTPS